jgi:hypothetical protein
MLQRSKNRLLFIHDSAPFVEALAQSIDMLLLRVMTHLGSKQIRQRI